MNKRLLFVFIIIIVDFIYVYNSQNVYNKTFDQINSKSENINTNRKIIGALSAYTFMAIGWYFLIGTKIESLLGPSGSSGNSKKQISNVIAIGAWCGFLYAALVYGVYNFTMYASVEKWSGYIMMRDITWGFTSSILMSIIYALWYTH
uniref:DUF1761 domain-containing protein n=1 Tax=viral metagenome TaxID=1070528 RepID=A0A6C0KVD0_9ZZZZ